MNKREIATLAVKLMALLLAFQAVDSAQSLLNNWHAFPGGTPLSLIVPFLLSAGIALGIGLLVWMSADSLARRVFPDESPTSMAPGSLHSSDEIMHIAIAIIGIWMIITTGPSLISNIILYLFVWRTSLYDSAMGGSVGQSSPLFDQVFDIKVKANIVSTLIQFLIGLIFAINPGKILNTLEMLKAKMIKPAHEDSEENDLAGN